MADKTFTFTAKGRTPRPRSKRLRDCGGAGAAASSTTSSGAGAVVSGEYLPLTGGTVTGQVNFEGRVVIDGDAILQGTNIISGEELTDFEDLTHIYVARGTTLHRITAEMLAEYIYEHFNYLNALVDTLWFASSGGSKALADIVASNGVYDSFESDHPSLTIDDGLVTVGARERVISDLKFTLTLTYRFADGNTRSVAIPGAQKGYGITLNLILTVRITGYSGTSPSITVNGTTTEGTEVSLFVTEGSTHTWSATDGNVTKGGTVTVYDESVTVDVNLLMA